MEQNNYLEFEKSKAAVYTIMEAYYRWINNNSLHFECNS